jgi:hypothetical protein
MKIMNKYSQQYALLKNITKAGGNMTMKEYVLEYSDGKKGSLKDLSDMELYEFTQLLQARAPMVTQDDFAFDRLNPIRRAIIGVFRGIGKSPDDAKAWALKYGPGKKPLNKYNGQELKGLLIAAQKMAKDYLKSV